MFQCDACGMCCRNLSKSDIYIELDRGDGVCRYLLRNKCIIYKNRPIICKVDASYDLFFSQFMSKEKYYRLNKVECKKLKGKEGD